MILEKFQISFYGHIIYKGVIKAFVKQPRNDVQRYFITSVKKFKQRLATGKKCSIYPLLLLFLPDTSYISIKSNILKYMHSLFQILSD